MTDTWRDRAAAYALDALDPDGRAAFEARLADDPELSRLVDEYREAAAGIGRTVEAREPPPALRARVLRAAAEAGTETMPAVEDRGEPRAPGARGGTAPGTGRPPGRSRGSRLAWLGLAAAVAGLVWVGADNRGLRTEAAGLRTELDRLRASLADAEAELARLDSVAPVLAGPDVRVATLTAEGAEPGLRLLWNPERGTLLVAATDLPPPPEGRTYQLWGIRGAASPVSLGTFATGPGGRALLMLSPDVDGGDFDLGAVTEEPAGGSAQPTSAPFLAGPWRRAAP